MKSIGYEEAKILLKGIISKPAMDKLKYFDFYQVEEGELFTAVSGYQTFGSGNYIARIKVLAGAEPSMTVIDEEKTSFVNRFTYEVAATRGMVLKNTELDWLSGKTRYYIMKVYICL